MNTSGLPIVTHAVRKLASTLLPSALGLLIILCGSALLQPTSAVAQSATGWTGATDGLWNFGGNWTNGIPNTNPPPSGGQAARILNFGPLGNARPNSTNNMPGGAGSTTGVSGHRIFFNSGATNYTLYLFPGTNGTSINDFGGAIPKIQNDSTNVQTIDMAFRLSGVGNTVASGNRAAELNPINGDLVFTPNCTMGIVSNTELRFYSAPGFSVTINGPITNTVPTNTCALMTAGSGGLGATVVFFNSHTFTNTFINNGTVRLGANNVTPAPFTIGDTNLNNAGAVLRMDNGISSSSTLIIKAGSTNSRTIGNTAIGSGDAIFSGLISLGTNLTTSADPAGTLKFTGNLDFQNPSGTGPRTLTVSGAGNTVFSGNLTNAATGISVLTKTNAGTLSLLGTNAVRILYNLAGGVLSVTNAEAIGVPIGVNYPDKINFTGNATLRTINNLTLGRDVSSSDNAGLRINGGSAGTFDVTADTLTIDGVIAEFGAGSGSLIKTGAGTLALTQTNSYTGSTTISNGTLVLSGAGSISNSPNINVANGVFDVSATTFTLATGQLLKGNGSVNGAMTVNGTITPGASIGTLTFSNAPTLAGTLVAELNQTNAQTADALALTTGTLTYGGALIITNLGPTVTNGTFTLFSAPSYSGAFSTVDFPPGGAAHWKTNNLVVDGTILFTNLNPVAFDILTGVVHGGSVTVDVLDKYPPTDADGDSVSITGVSAASSGTSSFTSSNVTYIANGSAGTNTFTYTVTDTLGATDTKTVTVVVTSPQGFNQLSATTILGDAYLTYLGMPGTNYALDVTHDLPATNWTAVITNVAQTNGYLYFTNPISLSPTNDFYRTRYVP